MEFCNFTGLVHSKNHGSSAFFSFGISIHISLLHIGCTGKGNDIAFLKAALNCKINAVIIISTI